MNNLKESGEFGKKDCKLEICRESGSEWCFETTKIPTNTPLKKNRKKSFCMFEIRKNSTKFAPPEFNSRSGYF